MQPLSKNSVHATQSSSARELHTRSGVWKLGAGIVALGAFALGSVAFQNSNQHSGGMPAVNAVSAATPTPVATPITKPSAAKLKYRVVKSFAHDPNAFTQGLVWHDGGFYESTGLNGRSSLRRVEFPSGRVLKKVDVAPEFFAEGLTLVGEKLYQLTWQSQVGFVYDRKTFKRLDTFSYPTEGWGLAYDGKNLILSDGSANLYFYRPQDFKLLRTVEVKLDGQPVANLNELEYIEGKIWANIWQTDQIVVVNPKDGIVTGTLDLTGILSAAERTGGEDVLNGIAHDSKTGRIFITGKLWPKLFQIELEK